MTLSQWVTVGIVAAVFIPLACAVAVISMLKRRRTLLVEITAVQAGQYSAEVGYERFMERSARIRQYMLNGATSVSVIAYIASFWVPFILVFVAPGLVTRFAPFPGIPVFPTGFVMVALLGAITISLYDLLSGLVVERPAGARLGGPVFTRSAAFGRFFKRLLLIYLPPLVVVEALGVFVHTPATLFMSPSLDLAILALGVAFFFAVRLLPWLAPSAPLEQSAWVALASRTRDWARLASVDLEDVRVRYAARLRLADGAVRGWKRPTLYLSDLFLANSDWRQQDALVAQLLGMARQRASAPLAAVAGPAIDAVCIAFIVGSGLVNGLLGFFLLQNLRLLLIVAVSTLILLPVASIYLIYSTLRRRVFGRTTWRKQTLASDRFAMDLTGDPLALAIALHTVTHLSTAPRWLRATNDALMADRFAIIEQVLNRPGPRAPWANQPVPSIVAVAGGSFALTIPLTRASSPAPVPAATYPVGTTVSILGSAQTEGT